MRSKTSSPRATIVKPEQTPPITSFGIDMKVLLSTEATSGGLSVLMAWHKPHEGPPDHLHLTRDEVFFVLEGTYELIIGDQTVTAGAGTIAFIPRNVVHRFKNVGEGTACMLDWSLPGGQDHFFKAISELAAAGELTSEKALAVSKAFDTNFVPAP